MSHEPADASTLPPVLSGVAPYLQLSDAAAAAELYVRAFAAVEMHRHATEDGKQIMHLHLHLNGASVMLMDAFPEHGHPLEKPAAFTLHLQVDDAQVWWDRAVATGLEVVMPLEVQFWGDRYGALRDRFGVMWSIGGRA